jgi:mono/diheme cytochrome c family protein
MEVPARKRKDRDAAGPPEAAAAPGGDGGNLLLAGLLAHEFLSSGTVLGERRGPGRGPEAPAAAATGGGGARYEAVAALVLGGGARVPGVVNPAQLAAWVAGR